MKKNILLLILSTMFLQATPKPFNSLGTKLEIYRQNCKTYQNDFIVSEKTVTLCKKYYEQVDSAFLLGYKIDMYKDKNNKEKTMKYLTLLRVANKTKEHIERTIPKKLEKKIKLKTKDSKLVKKIQKPKPTPIKKNRIVMIFKLKD